MSMNSRERMRAVLTGTLPDRVPFFPTIYIDHACVACGKSFEDALVNPALGQECMLGAALRYQTDGVRDGWLQIGAPVKVIKESPSTAVVDCGRNFGQVSMKVMVDVGCEKAKTQAISCVLSKDSFHIGRLGAYVQKVAERGMFGLLTCNMRQSAHVVVPWGGREGRLGTNPMAFAAPTKGYPVVLDMATCMVAAGKVVMAKLEGKQLPENCIQDADGNPTTDPNDFYGPNETTRTQTSRDGERCRP